MKAAIMGIDPGLGGAFAVLFPDGSISVRDMPTLAIARGGKNKRELDMRSLAFEIDLFRPAHAFVEQVNAMPGQGVSSMFAFGKSYGAILGILAALGTPYTLVPPARWTKAMQVPKGDDAGRQRALQLFPDAAGLFKRKKDDGRADAALLALYGQRCLAGIIGAGAAA